jgi:hypothetical protein
MLSRTLNLILSLLALPICALIALMDHNNGRTFTSNLREVMGVDAQHKDQNKDLNPDKH